VLFFRLGEKKDLLVGDDNSVVIIKAFNDDKPCRHFIVCGLTVIRSQFSRSLMRLGSKKERYASSSDG